MKLFTPEFQLAVEEHEDVPVSLEELNAFPFENYMRGLETAFEHIEHLSRIQHIGSVHPISQATQKLVNIAIEEYHEYYGLKYQGIAIESLHVSLEEEGGFFHAIAAILKAIWNAIRNFFMNIWNFFKKLFGFSKEKKKKLKKKKEQIEQVDKKIEEVVKNPPKEEDFQQPTSSPSSSAPKYSGLIYENVSSFIQHIDSFKINQAIELPDSNILSYLLADNEKMTQFQHIRMATTNAIEGLKRYNDVITEVYDGFNKTIAGSERLSNFVDNYQALSKLPGAMMVDFDRFFDSFIRKLHPLQDRSQFKKGFERLSAQTRYRTLPAQADIGYLENPYYGEQHYLFKVTDIYRPLKREVFFFDTFISRLESKACQVQYVPYNEAKEIWDDYIEAYTLYDEQNTRNQNQFQKFEKTVTEWMNGIEELLKEVSKGILNESIERQNVLDEARMKGTAPNYGPDIPGSETAQGSIYFIMTLFRNYNVFIIKIFRQYTDYLVKMEKFFHFIEQTAGSTLDYFYKESAHFSQPDKLGLPEYGPRTHYSNR